MKRLATTLFLLAAAVGAEAASVQGVVVDPFGNPIAGARVTLSDIGGERSAETDARGHFSLDLGPAQHGVLTVEADGFAGARRAVDGEGAGDLGRIVLTAAPYAETVTITATRVPQRLSETAASVVALSSEDLASAAALPLDAVLREVPGFTLFRRSDSRSANPTTQGVSLRGVGGSGASRAVVLDDGVPLNDPFGGWIAWGRIVRGSLERVEVLRGGSSDLYGGSALTGAIHLIRRDPADSGLSLEASYGSQHSGDAAVFFAGRARAWGARLEAESYRTDGYVLVSPEQRGPVDRLADSRHDVADLTLEREASGQTHLFLRGSLFDESRGNGTELQTNDTRIGQISGGADGASGRGAYSVRAYGLLERYHQTFSSIAPDRTEETLTRRQTVPSSAAGLTGQWTQGWGAHRFVAGAEAREVSGSSDEVVFGPSGESVADAGGKQATGALFLEDLLQATSRLSVGAGIRFDAWSNFDAFRRIGPDDSTAVRQPLSSRSETAWSPRASVLFQATSALSLTASAYRSFRAPTLNELYRNFRAGNTVTLANENLKAERLGGGEIGARWSLRSGRVFARGTFFWTEIEGAVSNVTLSTTPSLITRQRENVGRTRARGVELDAEARIAEALVLSAGYFYADSVVERFATNPSLEGLRVAQVPKHQASLQVRYELRGGARFAVQARYVGDQFEDDANTLRLASFATVDALASIPLARGIEVFTAGENLTGKRYEVGRTPVVTLGPPRSVRGGVRLRFG